MAHARWWRVWWQRIAYLFRRLENTDADAGSETGHARFQSSFSFQLAWVPARGWKQPRNVQLFDRKNPMLGSKWPNTQETALKFKPYDSFGFESKSRLSVDKSTFFKKVSHKKKIAVIVDQSWALITSKSAHWVVPTCPRRFVHPARAGFFLGLTSNKTFCFCHFWLSFHPIVTAGSI